MRLLMMTLLAACSASTESAKHDDLWLLASLYDEGYVQAKVDASHVEKGERFRVGKVTSPLPLRRTKSGDWFSRKVVMEDLADLRAQYGERITPNTRVDAEKKTIDLELVVGE